MSQNPPTIKLKFPLKNYGHPGKSKYLMRSCFLCSAGGESTPLIRHQIIPRSYRKALPKHLIEPLSHDVVPLCTICKTKVEETYQQKREELERAYDLNIFQIPHPITGEMMKTTDRRAYWISKSAKLLMSKHAKLPVNVVRKAEEDVSSFFHIPVKELTDNLLQEAVDIFKYRLKHGEAMISHLHNADDIIKFITGWRNCFVTLEPENLDPNWISESTQKLEEHFVSLYSETNK